MRDALDGGFTDAAPDAARAFRAILTAMARPGLIGHVAGAAGPEPMSPAAAGVLLTLCDPTTPLHLAGRFDTDAVRAWVAFHIGAPLVAAGQANFALGDWADLLPLDRFRQGGADYPDRSATLIVEMADLTAKGATLTGPGIRETAALSLPDRAAFQLNAARFPLGLDFLFTAGDRVAALPRTTQVR